MFTSLFVCGIWTIVTGATQVIHKTIQTTIAGENVTLYCQLAEGYDVVQVTWQKENGKVKTNIATYSTTHGSKVLGKYQNHVRISQSGLNISTITFHAVTVKDEGCYNCIFNTFPLGSVPGRTCLKVYALMKPQLDVEHVTSPDGPGNEMVKISCSATGRPAPVITWKVPEHLRVKPMQYLIYHPNQTVTIVSNFTHMSSKDFRESPINCMIQHPSLNITQELTLHENGVGQAKRKASRIPVIVSFCIFVVVFILGLLTFSIYNRWSIPPQNERHDLLRMVLPICVGNVTCRRYSCPRKQAPVQPLHQENFLGG